MMIALAISIGVNVFQFFAFWIVMLGWSYSEKHNKEN